MVRGSKASKGRNINRLGQSSKKGSPSKKGGSRSLSITRSSLSLSRKGKAKQGSRKR